MLVKKLDRQVHSGRSCVNPPGRSMIGYSARGTLRSKTSQRVLLPVYEQHSQHSCAQIRIAWHKANQTLSRPCVGRGNVRTIFAAAWWHHERGAARRPQGVTSKSPKSHHPFAQCAHYRQATPKTDPPNKYLLTPETAQHVTPVTPPVPYRTRSLCREFQLPQAWRRFSSCSCLPDRSRS